MTGLRAFCSLLLLIPTIFFSIKADGHETSESYLFAEINGPKVELLVQAAPRDIARLGPETTIKQHLEQAIGVRSRAGACRRTEIKSLGTSGSGLERLRLTYACLDGAEIELRAGLFSSVMTNHVTLASGVVNGGTLEQFAFGAGLNTWRPTAEGADISDQSDLTARMNGLERYLALGFIHIFLGADHMLFLFGLVACYGLTRGLVWAISGFTLGHSISLALISLQLVQPPGYLTESMIGLTIMLIGLDGLLESKVSIRAASIPTLIVPASLGVFSLFGFGHFQPWMFAGLGLAMWGYTGLAGSQEIRPWLRPLATIMFGLVHGSGFAGGLIEIGLPTGKLIGSILAFNVGVEFGQLTIAGISALLLRQLALWLGRSAALSLSIFATASYGSAQFALRVLN